MRKKDIIRIAVIALITFISFTLPSYLLLRGLPLPWAIIVFIGYITIAILGYLYSMI